MLWLALFRIANLQRESGLSTSTKTALAQLSDAIPIIDSMFNDYPAVAQHASRLASAVLAGNYVNVTVDFSEIESRDDPVAFHAQLRYALLSLAGEIPVPVGRSSLLHLAGINSTMPLAQHHFTGDLLDGS